MRHILQALLRDGFRYVALGGYDCKAEPELGITAQHALAHGGFLHTQCAHILPNSAFSSQSFLRHHHDKMSTAHSLSNVMTMSMNKRDFFDRLDMCFEKIVRFHIS